MRGIANLGNTCFLTTVLQATVRAPTVSGFFLRDGHNRDVCGAERAGRRAAAADAGRAPALEAGITHIAYRCSPHHPPRSVPVHDSSTTS